MDSIYLIHGLFMPSWVMLPLARRLRKKGYIVYLFSYRTRSESLTENAARLIQHIETHQTKNTSLHFVGHSLGGLLIRHAYRASPQIFTGTIVTIGTPHQGSQIAQYLTRYLPFNLLGKAYNLGLDGQLPDWEGDIALGSIAGTKTIGANTLLRVLKKPHDGTVSINETLLNKQQDHISLPYSHTALIFSTVVAQQVAHFIAHSAFHHQT